MHPSQALRHSPTSSLCLGPESACQPRVFCRERECITPLSLAQVGHSSSLSCSILGNLVTKCWGQEADKGSPLKQQCPAVKAKPSGREGELKV